MVYLTLKTLHIVFVSSWFVGLFYFPRILVNIAEVQALDANPAVLARLNLMATRLYRFSVILACVALVLGLCLWLGYDIGGTWLWTKLVLVACVIGYHHSCGVLLRKLNTGKGRTSRWYRVYNEVSVLLMLAIVALVVFKPFA